MDPWATPHLKSLLSDLKPLMSLIEVNLALFK